MIDNTKVWTKILGHLIWCENQAFLKILRSKGALSGPHEKLRQMVELLHSKGVPVNVDSVSRLIEQEKPMDQELVLCFGDVCSAGAESAADEAWLDAKQVGLLTEHGGPSAQG